MSSWRGFQSEILPDEPNPLSATQCSWNTSPLVPLLVAFHVMLTHPHVARGEQRTGSNVVPKVTFVNENRTVEVERGASLRYAALENDVPLYCMWFGLSKLANCHGNGLCWTDRVEISPATAVNPKTALENAMTRVASRKNPLARLACQVEVLDDCEVRTRCKGRR